MNVTLTIRANTSSYSFPFTVTVDTMNITAGTDEDYTPGGYTVTFQPNQTVATLVVPTTEDTIVEVDEMYSATITDTSEDRVLIGSPYVANVTIQDNEGMYICPFINVSSIGISAVSCMTQQKRTMYVVYHFKLS